MTVNATTGLFSQTNTRIIMLYLKAVLSLCLGFTMQGTTSFKTRSDESRSLAAFASSISNIIHATLHSHSTKTPLVWCWNHVGSFLWPIHKGFQDTTIFGKHLKTACITSFLLGFSMFNTDLSGPEKLWDRWKFFYTVNALPETQHCWTRMCNDKKYWKVHTWTGKTI